MIAVIALIVLGPSRLPEAARSIGKGMREMRNSFQGAAHDRDDDRDDDDRDESPAPLPTADGAEGVADGGPPDEDGRREDVAAERS